MLHNANLANELKAISLRFIGRIEEWLPEMESIRADAEFGMLTKADLKGLIIRIHKIAGSAGSFGFSRLSVTASELEQHLDLMSITGHAVEPIAKMLPSFDIFLDEARTTVITSRKMGMNADSAIGERLQKTAPEPTPPTLDTSSPRAPIIMVVDDDDLMRAYITKALARNGWSFIEADNGQKALDTLNELAAHPEENYPDLIIMDVQMPKMDGFETLSKINSSPNWQDIPIIMLTANYEDFNIISGFSKGALDYLTKPIEIADLQSAVQNLLRQTATR